MEKELRRNSVAGWLKRTCKNRWERLILSCLQWGVQCDLTLLPTFRLLKKDHSTAQRS